eukprot:6212398-Pleurochrysis_carterae.AAC.7
MVMTTMVMTMARLTLRARAKEWNLLRDLKTVSLARMLPIPHERGPSSSAKAARSDTERPSLGSSHPAAAAVAMAAFCALVSVHVPQLLVRESAAHSLAQVMASCFARASRHGSAPAESRRSSRPSGICTCRPRRFVA